MNYGSQAYYLSRLPIQQQSQGLTRGVIHSEPPLQVNMHSENLENTILGNYPSLIECMAELSKSKVKSKAFSRDFAVSKLGRTMYALEYKGRCIGIKTSSENHFTIWREKDSKFISRFLDELDVPYVFKDSS